MDDILRVAAPSSLEPPATCSWHLDKHGFSVRSAYKLLQADHWNDSSQHWNLAWQWNGPQRIRTFLWLALSNKLLTNSERYRRHMTQNAGCSHCGSRFEDIDHVLRTCSTARACWTLIIPADSLPAFYHQPAHSWLLSNLRQQQMRSDWSTMFGILCWKFWTARNRRIFEDVQLHPHSLIQEAVAFFNYVIKAHQSVKYLRVA